MAPIRSISPAGGLTAGSIHAERELDDRLTDRDALEPRCARRRRRRTRDPRARRALACATIPRAARPARRARRGARGPRDGDPSIDEATARQRLRETDLARERFVRDIYGLDPTDPGLYALVLDGTAFTRSVRRDHRGGRACPRAAPSR